MKRTWITVKRGLLEPKHRFALGELIWLFIYILDITNWESGIIEEWSDRGTSEEMDMPIDTLRDQRRKLEEKGYITCERKQRGIRIIVHNWTNPKEYTGHKYNEKPPSGTPSSTPSGTPSGKDQRENLHSSLYQKSKVNNHNEIQQKNLAILYIENIGEIYGKYLADAIELAEKEYPNEWFEPAIMLAVNNNVRKWSYIKAILDDWKANGVKIKTNKQKTGISKPTGTIKFLPDGTQIPVETIDD